MKRYIYLLILLCTNSFIINSQTNGSFQKILHAWKIDNGLYYQKTIYGYEFENVNWQDFKKSNKVEYLTATLHINKTLKDGEGIKFSIAQTRQEPSTKYSYEGKKKKEFLYGGNIRWGIEINCVSNGITENVRIIFRTDYKYVYRDEREYDYSKKRYKREYFYIWPKYDNKWNLFFLYNDEDVLSDDPKHKTEVTMLPYGGFAYDKNGRKIIWTNNFDIQIDSHLYTIPNVTRINYVKILVGPYAEVYVSDIEYGIKTIE